MYVCVYVCMYVCMHVCMYVFMYMCIVCTCTYVPYMYVYMYMCVYVHGQNFKYARMKRGKILKGEHALMERET